MTLESILISDEDMNLTTVAVSNNSDERKVQETVDFKMVTFSLSGKDYAIDIMYIKEIAKAGQFTYVPNTLPFVVGVYNLRGEIIPILDMRIFFNIGETKIDPNSTNLQNLLILTVGEQTFGIIVDKIDKVVGIQKSSIQPSHPLFADINIKYISGVVENNKHLYILLDIERIFSRAKNEEDIKYEKRLSEVAERYEAERVAKKESSAPLATAPASASAPAPAEENKPEPAVEALQQKVEAPAVQPEVKAETPAPAPAADAGFDETNYNFVLDGLKNHGKFYVSGINEGWVKHRFGEWSKERSGSSVQIQSPADSTEYLKSFWSSCSGSWWTKEYADALFKILPENSAKQVVVWNPGCGSGMETYCLACVLAKKYPDSKVRVYAQDVDLLAVSNAPMLTLPDDPKYEWMSQFLTKTASGENAFNQQIKDSIMFEYHDCQHTNALPMVDLIFARDLLSLLEPEVQNAVLNDFMEKLKGNGTVILGENESVPDSSDFMEHTEGALTAFSKQ